MNVLIKQAKVIYPGDSSNGQVLDILLNNGVIIKIDSNIAPVKNTKVIDRGKLILIPSLTDAQSTIGEPGFEYKEDLKSAAEAAKNGGFGNICMLPNTQPKIDSRGQLEHIKQKSQHLGINIIPYATVSRNGDGKDLSDMFDLHEGGAIAFSDGKNPIEDVNLMKRALEYTKSFGGIVCSFPQDDRINPGGMVNESEQNLKLGLKSTPAIAEELMVNRDLYLQAYTSGNLHFSSISSKGSVALIKEAKSRGQRVTAAVSLANLIYTDSKLQSFDTAFKTSPVLREEADRKALIEGLKNGTIDFIISDHTPENIENKDIEFDHASYGMTMLETALSLINEHLTADLDWETIASSFALNPRKRFNLAIPSLTEGSAFDFVLFDPNHVWTYNKASKASKSSNSPSWNKEMKGKVIRVD